MLRPAVGGAMLTSTSATVWATRPTATSGGGSLGDGIHFRRRSVCACACWTQSSVSAIVNFRSTSTSQRASADISVRSTSACFVGRRRVPSVLSSPSQNDLAPASSCGKLLQLHSYRKRHDVRSIKSMTVYNRFTYLFY